MSGSIARACCLRIGAPSPPFCPAAPPHWAVNSTGATAARSTMPITPAITAPAPNAVTPMPPSGSTASAASCCPCPITWSPSPCPPSCARSSAPTRRPLPAAAAGKRRRLAGRRPRPQRSRRPDRLAGRAPDLDARPALSSPRPLRRARRRPLPRPPALGQAQTRATSCPNRAGAALSHPAQAGPAAAAPPTLRKSPAPLWPLDWVADVQPVGTGEPALKYLAAYVYRTALSAERILADDGQHITFSYRDSQDGRTHRALAGRTVPAPLPPARPAPGLQRVRHFGFLSAAATKLATRPGAAGLEAAGVGLPAAPAAGPCARAAKNPWPSSASFRAHPRAVTP